TPICPSSRSMVLTSFRCGTLPSCSGSRVSNAAHISGSAAFLAPETRTSPESGLPPSMTSLSIGLLGRERAHRQRVYLLAHALAERGVHELVTLHPRFPAEGLAHDQRLEVLAVAGHAHFAARQSRLDVAAQVLGCHHVCVPSGAACSPASAWRAPPPTRARGSRAPRRGSGPDRRRRRRRIRAGNRQSCR